MIYAYSVPPHYFEALRAGYMRALIIDETENTEPFVVGDFVGVNELRKDERPRRWADEAVVIRCLLFEILHILRGNELQTPGTVILSLSLRPLGPDDVAAIR